MEDQVSLNLWFVHPPSSVPSPLPAAVSNAPPTPPASRKKRKSDAKPSEKKSNDKKLRDEDEIQLLEPDSPPEDEGQKKRCPDEDQFEWLESEMPLEELDKLGIRVALMSYGDCSEIYQVLVLPSGKILQVSRDMEMNGPGCFHTVGTDADPPVPIPVSSKEEKKEEKKR